MLHFILHILGICSDFLPIQNSKQLLQKLLLDFPPANMSNMLIGPQNIEYIELLGIEPQVSVEMGDICSPLLLGVWCMLKSQLQIQMYMNERNRAPDTQSI